MRHLLLSLAAFACVACCATSKASAQGEASRLHAIFVANTDDPNIGYNCGQDVQAFRNMLVAALGSSRLTVHNLTGNSWSSQRIQNYLAGLRIGSNDSILFYHSGHGAIRYRNTPADSHEIVLNRNWRLRRGDVRSQLLRHNPRALIVLTDCCSSYMSIAAYNAAATARPNDTTMRNLFLRSRGLVDITAAEDGTNAVATHAGSTDTGAQSAFTVALLTLMSSRQSYDDWQDFFPSLRRQTYESSGHKHRARAFKLPSSNVSPPTLPSPLPSPGPAIQLAGSSWSGQENLQGFGKLRFDFTLGNRVYMTDQKQKVAGTYSVQGNQVRLSFFDGSCIYTGNVNGSRLSGNAVARRGQAQFTWTTARVGSTPGVPSISGPITVSGVGSNLLTQVSWTGREDLSGYGNLSFSFRPDGEAVMVDARGTQTGTWSRSGNVITIRFANCVYQGQMRGRVLTGTGVITGGNSSGQRWNFQVTG